jgi:hypothetical protein
MILALACERLVVAVMVGFVNRRGLLRSRVAIVGSNDLTQIMMSRLSAPDMQVKYELLGLFHDPEEAGTPQQSVGTIADLGRYAQSNPVDLIVVCLPWQSAERRQRIIEQVQWIAADVVIPIESGEQRGQPANIADIGGLQMLQVMHRPFKGSQGLLKIAEDYVVGALALFLTAPLMLLAAVAIRLDSPGPILFRQARTGFNNKPFMIYKFRTMRVDPAQQAGLLRAVTEQLPNVSGIRVADILEAVGQILGQLATALAATGSLTLVSGALVLAGAVASGQRRRMGEAVILKSLGASRWQIRGAWLVEFGINSAVPAANGPSRGFQGIVSYELQTSTYPVFAVRTAGAGACDCPYDLNGDRVVNGSDLGTVLSGWSTSNALADVNHDGLVDGQDLALVLGGWGSCP